MRRRIWEYEEVRKEMTPEERRRYHEIAKHERNWMSPTTIDLKWLWDLAGALDKRITAEKQKRKKE